MRKFIYTLLGVSLCFSAFAEQATKESPNILIIMADDVGQGDLSCYGATAISTPNLDAFAKDGVFASFLFFNLYFFLKDNLI